MCKYCELEEEYIRRDDIREVYLLGDFLYVTALREPQITTQIEIKYCPMCGEEV